MTEEAKLIVDTLRACAVETQCSKCVVFCGNDECLFTAAAKQIESLSAQLDQVTRERGAAVEDIQKATIYLCQVCKKYHPAQKDVHPHYCEELGSHPDYGGAIACSMFEWRGIQEEV